MQHEKRWYFKTGRTTTAIVLILGLPLFAFLIYLSSFPLVLVGEPF
ncbi:hypothetical protein [Aquibium oceanicum]|nr:hypothetical protein [Aquibium oceanicum]